MIPFKRKYDNEGNLLVLVAHGFGAGFSTWLQPEAALDSRLIEAVQKGIVGDDLKNLMTKLGYNTGIADYYVEIEKVPKGTLFLIQEYDGAESIVTDNIWEA